MTYQYYTAILLPEGSEAPIRKYMEDLEIQFGFGRPLPPQIPLAAFETPFPPDRIDRAVLKQLPALAFTRPALQKGDMVMEAADPDLLTGARNALKGVNGKEPPQPLAHPFFDWKGLLLCPEGFPGAAPADDISRLPELPEPHRWHTWRLGLFQIILDPRRLWWEHLSWELLWTVRKARKN